MGEGRTVGVGGWGRGRQWGREDSGKDSGGGRTVGEGRMVGRGGQWGRGGRWGWEDNGEGRTVEEGGQWGAVESGRKQRSRTVLGLDTPCYPSPKALIKVCRSLCSQRPTASY